MRYAIGFLAAVVCLGTAWASEPGEPLDCSDMVFAVPGLSCVPFVPIGEISEGEESAIALWWRGSNLAFDNLGGVLYVRQVDNATIEVRRKDAVADVLVANVSWRVQPYGWDGIHPRKDCVDNCGEDDYLGRAVAFDPTNGRLLVWLTSKSTQPSGGPADFPWIASIEGFATTLEIFQTYTPTANEIGFRVPVAPEGFAGADTFDTYQGDLATVGDWSQVHPLQCDYPAAAPSTGDYLTVADPLPNPPPGHGRYYVTAVTRDGQTRYGRKSSGGVLTGRDPALLPVCDVP